VGETTFSKLTHVGIVVRDMDRTVESLASLGIGPFELQQPGAPLTEALFRGKPARWKTKRGTARIGQVELELLQPVEGESAAKEFLDSRGEGVHHIGFAVDDLNKEVARLVKQRAKVLMSGRWAGGGFAYIEPAVSGGIVIELIQQ